MKFVGKKFPQNSITPVMATDVPGRHGNNALAPSQEPSTSNNAEDTVTANDAAVFINEWEHAAETHAQNCCWQDVIQCCNQILAIPGQSKINFNVLHLIGIAYMKLGRGFEAFVNFVAARDINPHHEGLNQNIHELNQERKRIHGDGFSVPGISPLTRDVRNGELTEANRDNAFGREVGHLDVGVRDAFNVNQPPSGLWAESPRQDSPTAKAGTEAHRPTSNVDLLPRTHSADKAMPGYVPVRFTGQSFSPVSAPTSISNPVDRQTTLHSHQAPPIVYTNISLPLYGHPNNILHSQLTTTPPHQVQQPPPIVFNPAVNLFQAGIPIEPQQQLMYINQQQIQYLQQAHQQQNQSHRQQHSQQLEQVPHHQNQQQPQESHHEQAHEANQYHPLQDYFQREEDIDKEMGEIEEMIAVLKQEKDECESRLHVLKSLKELRTQRSEMSSQQS